MSLLCFHDLFTGWVPDCYALVEVRVVREVAADRGVVAEDFVFDNRFARADGAVEVGLVVDGVAVAGRIYEGLAGVVDFPS